MTRRDDAIKLLQPFIEKARTFSGWDFDDLHVTRATASPYPNGRNVPWDYIGLVREHAASAGTVVDFGTGGGDRYARIVEEIDARCVATAARPRNSTPLRSFTAQPRPASMGV